MKKNKLTNMELDSVDLCKQGANQLAHIKLYKSAPERKTDMEHISKHTGTAQIAQTTEALRKSLHSILADDSLDAVKKQQMMEDSLLEFAQEAASLVEGWAQAVDKADAPGGLTEEDLKEGEAPEEEPDTDPAQEEDDMEENTLTVGKAVLDMDKLTPEDKAALEALTKKYSPQPSIHPDVQKAIDEVALLRKSLELEKLEAFAKKYEILGKKAPELAQKLYDLKQAGEQHYNDYVALLDEQVSMAGAGIFKEYGSGRTASDLDSTVAQMQKADPSLTRAQAVVKAFEMNPALDPFTGRVK